MTFNLEKIYSEYHLPGNYVRFYLVGFLLFFIPQTRSVFIAITAPSLLLVYISVFIHHKYQAKKDSWVALFIVIAGFFVEVAGVQTGTIFGYYTYQEGLGIKFFDTPILIGINWLFMVYASHSIVSLFLHNKIVRVFLGALLMVLYDLILEFAAPLMNMWYFEDGYPPVINFIAWYALGLFFLVLVEYFGIKTNNKPARALFIIQLLFFAIIAMVNLIFKI